MIEQQRCIASMYEDIVNIQCGAEPNVLDYKSSGSIKCQYYDRQECVVNLLRRYPILRVSGFYLFKSRSMQCIGQAGVDNQDTERTTCQPCKPHIRSEVLDFSDNADPALTLRLEPLMEIIVSSQSITVLRY